MSPQEIFCCFIPECLNSNVSSPSKRFARVPSLPKLRQLWIKAGLRLKIKVPVVDRTPMFCCEDHFDLKSDASKQWLKGGRAQGCDQFIKLKRGVVPHVFPSRRRPKIVSRTSKNKSAPSFESSDTAATGSKVIIKEESLNSDDLERHSPSDSCELQDSSPTRATDAQLSKHEPKTNGKQDKTSRRIQDRTWAICEENSNSGCRFDDDDLKQSKISDDEKNLEKSKGSMVPLSQVNASAKETSQKKVNNPKKEKIRDSLEIQKCKLEESTTETEEKQPNEKEKGLKRKTDDVESGFEDPSNSGARVDLKHNDGARKKRRKVVKEILAWIPSNPGAVPSPNVMQPLIVVQTPPVTVGADSSTSALQLANQLTANSVPSVASVPLVSGRETQFILTVPDKSSIVGSSGQPVMLAVPQGCSFSVDKLQCQVDSDSVAASASQLLQSKLVTVASSSHPTTAASNDVGTVPHIDTPVSDHNYNSTCLVEMPRSKTNRSKLSDHSEKAAFATTPMTAPVPMTKVAATPSATANASQPICSCFCSAENAQKRSFVDTTDLFDGSDKLSNSLQAVVDEFSALKKSVASLTKELQFFKAENKRLKSHNRALQETKNDTEQEETRKLELAADALKTVFTYNQIKLLLGPRNDKGRVKWTSSEMDSACTLSRISMPAYKYLVTVLKYPFPSLTTMRRYMDKVEREEVDKTVTLAVAEKQFMTDDYGILTPEDDALARAILDADSDEELERDEGAIREMKENELRQKSTVQIDQNSEANDAGAGAKEISLVPRCVPLKKPVEKRIVKIESQIHNKAKGLVEKKTDELISKHAFVVRPYDRLAYLNRNNIIQSKKSGDVNVEATRRIVKILRPPSLSADQKTAPVIRTVVRTKTKSAETSMQDVESRLQTVSSVNENTTELASADPDLAVGSGEVKVEQRRARQRQPVFIVANDQQENIIRAQGQPGQNKIIINHENTDLNYREIAYNSSVMEQSENSEIIPEYVEECGNQQRMFPVQVEQTQAEGPTMYEEVIIHCEGSTMFPGNEVINLSFQEDSSYL